MHRLTVLLLAACSTAPSPSAPAAIPAPDAAPAVPDAAPPPPTLAPEIAACLARGPLALVRVASATPDCSGVGHLRMILDVIDAGATSATRVYATCPLYGEECVLGGAAKAGVFLVAALRAEASAARTLYCVPLPATDATLECGAVVASEEEGRRLLSGRR